MCAWIISSIPKMLREDGQHLQRDGAIYLNSKPISLGWLTSHCRHFRSGVSQSPGHLYGDSSSSAPATCLLSRGGRVGMHWRAIQLPPNLWRGTRCREAEQVCRSQQIIGPLPRCSSALLWHICFPSTRYPDQPPSCECARRTGPTSTRSVPADGVRAEKNCENVSAPS
jgi:hypothetical protein